MQVSMQLEHYVFPEISISANKKYDPEIDFDFKSMELKINPQMSVNDPEEYLLQLDVWSTATDDDNFPYSFHITGVIKFSYRGIEDEAERNKRAFHNGASMLYAAIREQLVSLTSRNVYAPLFLPAWYFKPDDFTRNENN
jgi:preprotein translocase subunit SecB